MSENKDKSWPEWATVIRSWLLIAAGLIGAVTVLLFAVGKLGTAYDAACEAVPICPGPKWVDEAPVSISKAIAEETAFTFPALPETPPEGPKSGSQRYGTPSAVCSPIMQNAWKLHNGTIVLDSSPLIQTGWSSSSFVGEPEPPDWARFDRAAVAEFGWTPGFATNRCSAKQYCKLSPAEIKAHSEATSIPVEECARMRMVETNFSNAHSSLTVWIRGKADQDSLWTVTAPLQTYRRP